MGGQCFSKTRTCKSRTNISTFRRFLRYTQMVPGISGENGEIGCVRFCKGSLKSKDGATMVNFFAKERLIHIDHIEMSLSYEIFENNIGFNSYVATIKVVRADNDDNKRGCLIEWGFGVEPVDGWKLDDLVKSYEFWLQSIAKKMEDTLIM